MTLEVWKQSIFQPLKDRILSALLSIIHESRNSREIDCDRGEIIVNTVNVRHVAILFRI